MNALEPIDVIDLEIYNESVKPVHPEKALSPICVIEFYMSNRLINYVLFVKALFSIFTTL